MAGPAAIYFAADQPATLSCLILVDVAGLGPGWPELRWRDLPHLLLTKLKGHPTRGLVRLMWKNWVRRDNVDVKPLEEATYRFFRDTSRMLQDPTDDEDEDDDDLIDVLANITVSTLVLSGRYSTVLGPNFGRKAAELLPSGQHVEFEESSHALQLEEAAKFQETVAAFIARIQA